MGTETEWKFSADSGVFQRVQAAYPGAYRAIAMETVYYDTPAGALSQAGITLRRRRENGVGICTVKTRAQGLRRGEWECRAETIQAGFPELRRISSLEELANLPPESLIPICGARFTRRALEISLSGGTVELALDQGVLCGGGRELPFAEIEVEGKTGAESVWAAFVRRFSADFSLKGQPLSKFRRALDLAKGDTYG